MQIRIYFPQLGHPGFGLLRALVKDSTDRNTGPEGQTFLDSDGFVGRLMRNQSSPSLKSIAAKLQVADKDTSYRHHQRVHSHYFAAACLGDCSAVCLDFALVCRLW